MTASANAWKRGAFRFLSAQTVSLFGSSLAQYAIVWYITLTTASGQMLTLSTLCGFLPQICISLLAGVWLDRFDRKRLILLSDAAIALATLALALAFLSGRRSLPLLLCVLAVRSAGTGLQTPAVNAILPQLVPAPHLMRVAGLQSTLSSLTMLLSPAASGAVLSVFPLEAALFIDVATAILGVSITAAVAIPPYETQAGPMASPLRQLREGFAYLRTTPFVRRLLLLQLAGLFLITPAAFLTPLLVSRSFGPEPWRLAASEMTYSLGMVAGGVLITLWGGASRRLRVILAAGAAYGALMLGLGLAPVFWLYLLCNALIGVTTPCYNTPITVALQERVPAELQGRVFGFLHIATSCALPLGMALFGPLADRFAVEHLLVVCGCAVLGLFVGAARCHVLE